jgi:hypothetical protein
MNVFGKIWRRLFPTPAERRIREILSTEGDLDGVIAFIRASPFPGAELVAEWRNYREECRLSWHHFHGRQQTLSSEGNRVIAAGRFHEIVTRLDNMLKAKQVKSRYVKDGMWYCVAWTSGHEPTKSFIVQGPVDFGPCFETIALLQEDISLPSTSPVSNAPKTNR